MKKIFEKAQGAMEYMLILAGAIFVAAILLALLAQMADVTKNEANSSLGNFFNTLPNGEDPEPGSCDYDDICETADGEDCSCSDCVNCDKDGTCESGPPNCETQLNCYDDCRITPIPVCLFPKTDPHYECVGIKCKSVDGCASNECSGDADCTSTSPFGCNKDLSGHECEDNDDCNPGEVCTSWPDCKCDAEVPEPMPDGIGVYYKYGSDATQQVIVCAKTQDQQDAEECKTWVLAIVDEDVIIALFGTSNPDVGYFRIIDNFPMGYMRDFLVFFWDNSAGEEKTYAWKLDLPSPNFPSPEFEVEPPANDGTFDLWDYCKHDVPHGNFYCKNYSNMIGLTRFLWNQNGFARDNPEPFKVRAAILEAGEDNLNAYKANPMQSTVIYEEGWNTELTIIRNTIPDKVYWVENDHALFFDAIIAADAYGIEIYGPGATICTEENYLEWRENPDMCTPASIKLRFDVSAVDAVDGYYYHPYPKEEFEIDFDEVMILGTPLWDIISMFPNDYRMAVRSCAIVGDDVDPDTDYYDGHTPMGDIGCKWDLTVFGIDLTTEITAYQSSLSGEIAEVKVE